MIVAACCGCIYAKILDWQILSSHQVELGAERKQIHEKNLILKKPQDCSLKRTVA
jgi:hypothetical protein